MLTLVLGGEKSGKSDVALELLDKIQGPKMFVATGKAMDDSFRARIAAHRAERAASLPVAEVHTDLAGLLRRHHTSALLVDSLDFWLFSCGEDPAPAANLLDCLDCWTGSELLLVSSEVGLGPVAADASTRAFVRNLGALNRAVAARCQRVYLVAAGLPLTLKEPGA